MWAQLLASGLTISDIGFTTADFLPILDAVKDTFMMVKTPLFPIAAVWVGLYVAPFILNSIHKK